MQTCHPVTVATSDMLDKGFTKGASSRRRHLDVPLALYIHVCTLSYRHACISLHINKIVLRHTAPERDMQHTCVSVTCNA